MQDLSPLERKLFDWLSRRSLELLATLPVFIFVTFGSATVALLSFVARRSPIGDTYVVWVISALVISAMALYLACFYVLAAFFIRTRRFKLLELHQSMREIQAMSWQEFEDLVAASYHVRGYEIEQLGGDRPDGGVDLIARKAGETWLVQCKHYRNRWVTERPLRELLGVVAARNATGGVLITCGVFDEQALAFAKGNRKLELIGGEELRSLMTQPPLDTYTGPLCPKCGSKMRAKSGRFGKFLGCVNYPSCHGWRSSGVTPQPEPTPSV